MLLTMHTAFIREIIEQLLLILQEKKFILFL